MERCTQSLMQSAMVDFAWKDREKKTQRISVGLIHVSDEKAVWYIQNMGHKHYCLSVNTQ
jgi:hypothetical protein